MLFSCHTQENATHSEKSGCWDRVRNYMQSSWMQQQWQLVTTRLATYDSKMSPINKILLNSCGCDVHRTTSWCSTGDSYELWTHEGHMMVKVESPWKSEMEAGCICLGWQMPNKRQSGESLDLDCGKAFMHSQGSLFIISLILSI